MQPTSKLPVIGLDLAKSVFQVHAVNKDTGEFERRQVKRAKLAAFFAKRSPSLLAMEACGSSHHWARTIRALGHEVKLLPAQHVKAFSLRDKTDAMDAQAIWTAAQQPHILPVPVKSLRQQACLALHRMRAQMVKMRVMQTNALRGILAEFGIVMPVGPRAAAQGNSGGNGQGPGAGPAAGRSHRLHPGAARTRQRAASRH